MEETKNNKYDIFFRILFVLFVIFLCLYAISVSGYVEVENKNRTLYTEEQIQRFESDVMNGKEIDINEYIDNSVVDYSNTVSDAGEELSLMIDELFDMSFEYLEKIFKFMFE